MAAIHFIKKQEQGLPAILPNPLGQTTNYTSGFWTVSVATAQALVGGHIYFHEHQTAPSYFGGSITGFERIDSGEYNGRIKFEFTREETCKGVRTASEGWSQVMKLIGV